MSVTAAPKRSAGRMRVASVLLLGLAGSLYVQPQAHAAVPELSAGLNAAPILVNWSAGPDNSHVGPRLGVSLVQDWNPPLSLASEFSYVRKGLRPKYGPTISLDYVAVSALLRYSLGSSAGAPYLVFGPEVSYLVAAHEEFKLDGGVHRSDIRRELADADMSFNAGIGLRLSSRRPRPCLEARYSVGLTDIYASSMEGGSRESWYARGMYLMAGVRF